MSSPPTATRRRRPRPRRRLRGLAPLLLLIALCGVVFALGVGLGQALHENTPPEGTVTQVRTLEPATLAPEPETVTVTVSGP